MTHHLMLLSTVSVEVLEGLEKTIVVNLAVTETGHSVI